MSIRLKWSWIWKAALGVALLVAATFGGFLWGGATVVNLAKAAYDNVTWYDEEGGGINQSAFVKIGGYDQFVRIRGRDLSNPVIVYLHGGPGGALSGVLHRMFRPFTEYFTSAHAVIPDEYAKFLFHFIRDVRPVAIEQTEAGDRS